ncbi:hydantoinase/oxoprolinase N-terminal domain-containing protein, partial [Streptomyces sp. NPDC005989]|uniref:hydantoinase/oxoprolinase N-terminal domain-containing protein n=1 Tax=Streptomyces sp. NPDC005989 TaxID=3156727 RepID=UPI0033E9C26B
MILGVDVGPTNTDAVLLDGDRAVRAVKVPSLAGDAVGSLAAAVRALPAELRGRAEVVQVPGDGQLVRDRQV